MAIQKVLLSTLAAKAGHILFLKHSWLTGLPAAVATSINPSKINTYLNVAWVESNGVRVLKMLDNLSLTFIARDQEVDYDDETGAVQIKDFDGQDYTLHFFSNSPLKL